MPGKIISTATSSRCARPCPKRSSLPLWRPAGRWIGSRPLPTRWEKRMAEPHPLPGGTVTFLFTDIEGSTRLWEENPDAMRLALARHDALLGAAIETNGGQVFKTG